MQPFCLGLLPFTSWPADEETASWLLGVIGKSMKPRCVPISDDSVDAVRDVGGMSATVFGFRALGGKKASERIFGVASARFSDKARQGAAPRCI